jgi:hypothetical protein
MTMSGFGEFKISIRKPRLPLRVSHSAITQRVGVMNELVPCQKNTSMGDAGGGIAGCSYHGKKIGRAII